jgi:hypothetical protein
MRSKVIKGISYALFIVFIIWLSYNANQRDYKKDSSIPSLPQAIGKETVLITSAGQSTDTYIVKDIANKLRIHNFFMPQAVEPDLEGINTVVFVVGFSEYGEKLHGVTFESEKQRVESLLKSLKKNQVTIISVYLGGKHRRNLNTDTLLKMTCSESQYLIATVSADEDNYLSNLSNEYNIPLTLVEDVKNISEPFASAFR